MQASNQKPLQKEITITQSSLIEVSSDDDDDDAESQESQESDSDSDSDESDSESDESKWSIGDEIHQPDSYHQEFTESFKKDILIDAIRIDSSYVVDSITVEQKEQKQEEQEEEEQEEEEQEEQKQEEQKQEEQEEQKPEEQKDQEQEPQQKKIIYLNRGALNNHDDSDDDDDDDDSSSSEDQVQDQDQDQAQDQDHVGKEHKDNDVQEFELKIGYKPSSSSLNKAMQLNYGNMSVSALRQLAKERGLGGEEGDLQKLKKKDLVQLLQ
jgi:hypothetical protein